MKVSMGGKVVPLNMVTAGFELGMSRDLARHGFERNPSPTGFHDVYTNRHTGNTFLVFVRSCDANAQFNVV